MMSIWSRPQCVNTFRSGDTYIHQLTGSSLVTVMAPCDYFIQCWLFVNAATANLETNLKLSFKKTQLLSATYQYSYRSFLVCYFILHVYTCLTWYLFLIKTLDMSWSSITRCCIHLHYGMSVVNTVKRSGRYIAIMYCITFHWYVLVSFCEKIFHCS